MPTPLLKRIGAIHAVTSFIIIDYKTENSGNSSPATFEKRETQLMFQVNGLSLLLLFLLLFVAFKNVAYGPTDQSSRHLS